MTYWPFWLGGIALAAVALGHWLLVGKLMSVSSRFSMLVDRVRGEATREPPVDSLIFFGGLALGGLIAALVAGGFHPSLLASPGRAFETLFGSGTASTVGVCSVGGVLVGFGTRMGTGCTSGHGLCGVARFEKGSLLATAAFFGVGCLVSIALGALS